MIDDTRKFGLHTCKLPRLTQRAGKDVHFPQLSSPLCHAAASSLLLDQCMTHLLLGTMPPKRKSAKKNDPSKKEAKKQPSVVFKKQGFVVSVHPQHMPEQSSLSRAAAAARWLRNFVRPTSMALERLRGKCLHLLPGQGSYELCGCTSRRNWRRGRSGTKG